MRQIGGAYRKARLSDAQKLFVKGKEAKARFCLRENFLKKHPKFYILHSTFYIFVRERAGAYIKAMCRRSLPSPLGEGGGAADGRGEWDNLKAGAPHQSLRDSFPRGGSRE